MRDNFTIIAQAALRTRTGKVFVPDFVVVMHSALAVEIDGSSHVGRYGADRSRDELLRDCNMPVIRVPIEDTEKPELLEDWVDRVLTRVREFRFSAA